MVCAMHRLFQSEEDDRIMEGEIIPSSGQEQDQNIKKENTQKKPLKTTLRGRIIKSLGHFIQTKISS